MKKNFMWTMAALFVSGFAFTACQVEDNPNPDPTWPENIEDIWEKSAIAFDFEDGEAIFASTQRMTPSVVDDAEKESKVLQLKNAGNAGNQYGFAYYNFGDKFDKPTKLTIKFDYKNGGVRDCMTIGDGAVRGTNGAGAGCARYTYGKKGAILAVGATTDGKSFFVNDSILGAIDDWKAKWITVEVGVYVLDRQVEWVIKNGDEILAQSGVTEGEGEAAKFTPGKVEYWDENAGECTQIDAFGYANNTANFIDNLSITSAKDPDIKYAEDVKITYVDANGKELKDSRTISAPIGSKVRLTGTDKAAFKNAEGTMKYIYESDNTETTPVAEKGTVIKVVFREAEKNYAVLRCMAGSTQLFAFNDANKYWFFEGDEMVIYPARCYGKDGVYYTTELSTCSDNKKYNSVISKFPGTITPTTTGGKTYYIGIQNYEKDDNVVYFANFEDLALPKEDAGNGTGLAQLEGTVSNWMNWTNGLWERLDGGRGITLDMDSYVWTEPIAKEGTYTVSIYLRNDAKTNTEKPFALGVRDANGQVTMFDTLTIPTWNSGITGACVVENVAIPAGNSLVIKNTEETNLITLDDIMITKPAAEE